MLRTSPTTDFGISPRIVFSADGKLLVAGKSNQLILWDMSTGKELGRLKGHSSTSYALAFSPDNKMLASGGYDGTIVLWDLDRQQRIGPPL